MKRILSAFLMLVMLFGCVACSSVGGGGATTTEDRASGNASIAASAGASVSASLSASGMSSGNEPIAVPTTGITLSSTALSLAIGGTSTLTATITPADATSKEVTFISSNSAVATVSADGLVTAKAAGTAAIVAVTTNGKVAICTVTVASADAPEIPVTGVTLNNSTLALAIGDTSTLTATIAPNDATRKAVTYTSSNSAVATVNENGVVTAKAAGTAAIVAVTENGKLATCTVTVASADAPEVPATGVTLNNTTLSLAIGGTSTLTATVAPANATSKAVTYTSSNPTAATVDGNGVVTAEAAGTAAIVVVTDNGKVATCVVTVASADAPEVPATGVTLNNTTLSLVSGGTSTLTATIAPADATSKAVTYTSSNSAVATVNANGVVTAQAAGTAVIVAATANGKVAICVVNVEEDANAMRDTNKQYRILFVGNSFTFTNDIPGLFQRICDQSEYDVIVDSSTVGGQFLWAHADATYVNGTGTSAINSGAKLAEKLAATKYDIVIIQEQSGTPVADPAIFYTGARMLAEKVKENGAELYVYATWGYKEGYSKLPTHGGTPAAMEMKLRAAYHAIAEELGAGICHVGAAFTDVHLNYGAKGDDATAKINLYSGDKYHPGYVGSSLSAYTIFASIFRADVRSVNCDLLTTAHESPQITTNYGEVGRLMNGMTAAEGNTILKNAAYKAAFLDHDVLPAYKTSSVGVGYTPSDVDTTKTQILRTVPTAAVISVIKRNNATVENGWLAVQNSTTQTLSGIRGDLDRIAAAVTGDENGALRLNEKMDIGNTGYGVSVIGLEKLGNANAVSNLVNGKFSGTANGPDMASLFFDQYRYNVGGVRTMDGEFTALITLNFGSVHSFDAIGYVSGSRWGIPQAQKVYVSDDGMNWTLVAEASYDALKMAAKGDKITFASGELKDELTGGSGNNMLFSMNGATGKYIRIGIIAGAEMASTSPMLVGGLTSASKGQDIYNSATLDVVQRINTRELVVFGSKR